MREEKSAMDLMRVLITHAHSTLHDIAYLKPSTIMNDHSLSEEKLKKGAS
jgi:hypothetical protein